MSNSLIVRFVAVVLAVFGLAPILTAQTAKDGSNKNQGTAGYERYRGDKTPYKPKSAQASTAKSSSNSADVSKEKGGAEAIKNSYAREASFERKNNAFGGLFSNSEKKAILKKRLQNEMGTPANPGTDPRTAMDAAFGDYIAKGISRYEDRGQKIVFDSSLTALDKALAIYRSTRGSDVPRLKEYMLNGRPMPSGTNDENILITEVHVYPDQLSRDQMLAKLGPQAFGRIYSDELKTRTANPQKETITVKSDEDAVKLIKRMVEVYGVPDQRSIYDLQEGDSQTISIFNGNPSKTKLFPNPNWVVIEYPPQAWQAFTADQAQSFNVTFNGRYMRIFENIDQVSDLQLSNAIAVHTSVSNFDELQARMSRPVVDRMAKEAAAMLSNLDAEIYQVCRECMGIEEQTPAKKESVKKAPAKKPATKNQRGKK